jgi:lipopolysaccharide export system permease protein
MTSTIIKRQISAETLGAIFVVTLVLLIILLSTNMAKYLALAATGKVEISTVFSIIGLKLPRHITMLFPLSMLLGVLLVLGRMAQDQELTVLFASGISYQDLYKINFKIAFVLAVILGLISLYVFPVAKLKSLTLDKEIGSGIALKNISAGVFQELGGGDRVIYTEAIDSKNIMHEVFLQIKEKDTQHVLKARLGKVMVDNNGNTVLRLEDGRRYTGVPGTLEYDVVDYKYHAILLEESPKQPHAFGAEIQTSIDLWQNRASHKAQAELQWRLAIPIMALVMMIMGIALSSNKPRAGKYGKILPGVLFYFLYINLVIVVKNNIEDGKFAPLPGVWLVHILFLLLTGFLIWQTLKPLKR